MLRLRALVFLVGGSLAVAVLAGCDSGEEVTPVSTFSPEDPTSRQIFGRVYRGTEVVEGALVRVDAAPGLASDEVLAERSILSRAVSTDPSGFYRVQFAPFVYDVSVRKDAELFVMRGMQVRVVEPSLVGDPPVSGYKASVVPTTVPPPEPGHALTYLVSGADARSIEGTTGSLGVTFRKFDSVVTLHALEYVVADGLGHVVRSGKVDVRVRDGEVAAPTVVMTDVTTRKQVTFEATLPTGYTSASLEVELDAGLRKSAALVTKTTLGAPVALSIVPDVAYSVRGRTVAGGAVSYSGRFVFDANLAKVALLFPERVASEAPIDDDLPASGAGPPVLETGGSLAARFESGIVEHALTPAAGGSGPTLRLVTDARTTTLPWATSTRVPSAFALTRNSVPVTCTSACAVITRKRFERATPGATSTTMVP